MNEDALEDAEPIHSSSPYDANLSFEPCKVLLLLQLDFQKQKNDLEQRQLADNLAVEKLKGDLEQQKINLERERLSLVKEGRLSCGGVAGLNEELHSLLILESGRMHIVR